MKSKNRPKTGGRGWGSHPVQLEFTHPTATAVRIAGTFNDWRPEATPMIALGEGRWRKQLLLPPGTYEYVLVVDGKWMPDPLARARIPNPFGGVLSQVTVPMECESRGRPE